MVTQLKNASPSPPLNNLFDDDWKKTSLLKGHSLLDNHPPRFRRMIRIHRLARSYVQLV